MSTSALSPPAVDATYDALKQSLHMILAISHYLSSISQTSTISSLRVKVLSKQLAARKAIDEYVLSDGSRPAKVIALERVEDAQKAVARIISIFCVFGDPDLASQYAELRRLLSPSSSPSSHRSLLLEREGRCLRLHLSEAFGVPSTHTLLSWGVLSSPSDVPEAHTPYTFLPSPATSDAERRRREQLLRLRAALAHVRLHEGTKSFHRTLLLDSLAAIPPGEEEGGDGEKGAEAVPDSDEVAQPLPPSYSLQNFAYGTTPYHSYLQLHSCPQYLLALRSCVDSPSRQHVVFGSSVGLLNIYAALSIDVPGSLNSHGYELLPTLAALARKVVKLSCRGGGDAAATDPSLGITFHNADMLTAPLQQVQLLHLTSMCWDEKLTAVLDPHLLAGLPEGCVVVDYSTRLLGARCEQDGGLRFQLVWEQKEELGCSWSDLQKLYVFVKVKASEGAAAASPSSKAGAQGSDEKVSAVPTHDVPPSSAGVRVASDVSSSTAAGADTEGQDEEVSAILSQIPPPSVAGGASAASSEAPTTTTPTKRIEVAERRSVSPVAAVGAVGIIGAGLFALSRMFGGKK